MTDKPDWSCSCTLCFFNFACTTGSSHKEAISSLHASMTRCECSKSSKPAGFCGLRRFVSNVFHPPRTRTSEARSLWYWPEALVSMSGGQNLRVSICSTSRNGASRILRKQRSLEFSFPFGLRECLPSTGGKVLLVDLGFSSRLRTKLTDRTRLRWMTAFHASTSACSDFGANSS